MKGVNISAVTLLDSGARGKSWVLSCISAGYSRSTFKTYPYSPRYRCFPSPAQTYVPGATETQSMVAFAEARFHRDYSHPSKRCKCFHLDLPSLGWWLKHDVCLR